MIIDIRTVKLIARARKDYGDLDSLAASLRRHGQIQSVVVEPFVDSDNPLIKWRLVVGERRLRALLLNGVLEVEARQMGELDEVSIKEIELEENVARKDLEWPEQVELIRQLDELKRATYGDAIESRSRYGSGDDKWGLQDTADVVGCSKSAVAQDIQLAKELKSNPKLARQVRKLPKHAARKVVARDKKARLLETQIASKQLTLSTDLQLGPCEELISSLPDESIHMLLTDPPFALPNISTQGGMFQYNLTKTNVDEETNLEPVYKKLIPQLFKKLVPGAHVYMFCGMGWYCRLMMLFRETGFLMDDLPIVWWKKRVSMLAKNYHYMSSYETVLFGHKPPMSRILKKPVANVIDIAAVPPQLRIHSLQKPFDLLALFIENSTVPGEVVLDCFAGSGATLAAARKLKRSTIGFEKDKENFLLAQAFLKGG